MYEKILVPLDGSRTGEAALPFVEELASKLSPRANVEVTLFQVVSWRDLGLVGVEATPITEKELNPIIAQSMDYLNKAGEGLRKKGATVKTKVAIGLAAEEIIKAADEISADFIAMSTHGRSGISRWAFGSVADKVLQGATKPILLVRAQKLAA